MARIKIKDLPRNMKVSRKDMKKFIGGNTLTFSVEGQELSVLSISDTNKVFNDKVIDSENLINPGSGQAPVKNALF